MWNKNKHLFVILLVAILISHIAYAREPYEKGDAIYRDKQWPGGGYGHAGILCYWDESASNERSNQIVIESDSDAGVRITDFQNFKNADTFWGGQNHFFGILSTQNNCDNRYKSIRHGL